MDCYFRKPTNVRNQKCQQLLQQPRQPLKLRRRHFQPSSSIKTFGELQNGLALLDLKERFEAKVFLGYFIADFALDTLVYFDEHFWGTELFTHFVTDKVVFYPIQLDVANFLK